MTMVEESAHLSFEDFTVGRRFDLGPRTISAEEIVEFASEYDPQPFHLDGNSEQARQTGGMIASGWHICAVFMAMACEAFILESLSEGAPGIEEVRWLQPVRPGDTLRGVVTVMERRVSRSNPQRGFVQFECTLSNQAGESVTWLRYPAMVRLRDPEAFARENAS